MVKKYILEEKKNNELYGYIQPESRFVSQAVGFAYTILKERGENFSEDEKSRIEELIENKKTKENEVVVSEHAFDKSAVEDTAAIELYSKGAIWGFSILFGVLIGSILLTLNFKKLNKTSTAIVTVVFGILYTIFQVVAINYLESSKFSYNNSTFLFSAIGASILNYFFWNNYIEPDLKYRKKSVLIPAIICIVIFIPIVYIIIFE